MCIGCPYQPIKLLVSLFGGPLENAVASLVAKGGCSTLAPFCALSRKDFMSLVTGRVLFLFLYCFLHCTWEYRRANESGIWWWRLKRDCTEEVYSYQTHHTQLITHVQAYSAWHKATGIPLLMGIRGRHIAFCWEPSMKYWLFRTEVCWFARQTVCFNPPYLRDMRDDTIVLFCFFFSHVPLFSRRYDIYMYIDGMW